MLKLSSNIHPRFSEKVVDDLRRKSIFTVVDFIEFDSVKLMNSTGILYADILKMKLHILENYGSVKKNAAKLFEAECNDVISTGITCLDELLRGGLHAGKLCELCGSSSSGKTQLCLTIAANVAAQSDIAVWYFDTKRDFSINRFKEILQKRFQEEVVKKALQHTKICHVRTSRTLIRALRQLVATCKTKRVDLEEKRLLIIIDSLPAIIFKVTRENQKFDNQTIYELDELAEVCRLCTEYRAAIITVNSISRWNLNQTNPIVVMPTLGRYWAIIPATRLILIRRQAEARRILIWKDLRLEKNSFCDVVVNDAGITNT